MSKLQVVDSRISFKDFGADLSFSFFPFFFFFQFFEIVNYFEDFVCGGPLDSLLHFQVTQISGGMLSVVIVGSRIPRFFFSFTYLFGEAGVFAVCVLSARNFISALNFRLISIAPQLPVAVSAIFSLTLSSKFVYGKRVLYL